MRITIAACAAFFALATPSLAASTVAAPQLAQQVTAEQQQQLDQIIAAAAEAGKGKSEEERLALYRAAMPEIIEVLEPGTRSGAYAKVIAGSPAIRDAQRRLSRELLGGGGDIPFYP
jgi:hypothetical protein